MATVTKPTTLLDEFIVCDCVWDNHHDSRRINEHFVLDYQNEAYPNANRGWPRYYAPKKTVGHGIPLVRNSRTKYSNRGPGDFFGYADSVQGPGMGPPPIAAYSARDRILSDGVNQRVPLEGFVYTIPKCLESEGGEGFDGFGTRYHTITGSDGRVDQIGYGTCQGAYPIRWITDIPTAGITNRSWMWAPDVGAGISGAEFWRENQAAGDWFYHNPTLFGNVKKNQLATPNENSDQNILMSSPVVSSFIGTNSNGWHEGRAMTVPIEWSKDGIGNTPPSANEDHGNTDYQPVIWRRCLQEQAIEYPWRGYAGVGRLRARVFAPFTGDYSNTAWVFGLRTIDDFDGAYIYDPATDTTFDVAWDFALEGSIRYSNGLNWYAKEDPPGNPVVTGPTKTPSGHCGVILESRNTQGWATGDGMAVGLYSKLEYNFDNYFRPLDMPSGVQQFQIFVNHDAVGPYTPKGPTRQAINAVTFGQGRSPGWRYMQFWFCIGTLNSVRASMRQLYQDGWGNSIWTP